MADRNMKVGDTWPPLKGEARNEVGDLVTLADATALSVTIVGPVTITGPAEAINPPEDDPVSTHQWNWRYLWTPGDTDVSGDYRVELTVEWEPGRLQTFPSDGAPMLEIQDL